MEGGEQLLVEGQGVQLVDSWRRAGFVQPMRKSFWVRVDFWNLSEYAGGSILNHDLVALGFISGVAADKAKAVKQVLKEKVVIYSFKMSPCANR